MFKRLNNKIYDKNYLLGGWYFMEKRLNKF